MSLTVSSYLHQVPRPLNLAVSTVRVVSFPPATPAGITSTLTANEAGRIQWSAASWGQDRERGVWIMKSQAGLVLWW